MLVSGIKVRTELRPFFDSKRNAAKARPIPQQKLGILSICQILLSANGQKCSADEIIAIPAHTVAQQGTLSLAGLITVEMVFLFSL
jgi:hypothetical protein